MIVIGAGLAGLLAGNMLRKHRPTIYEKQSSLPNNHSAVLRFRSPIVGDTLGIPFRKVTMVKCAVPYENPVADALAYSHKCLGVYRSDRSIIGGTIIDDRWIAPQDLIQRMAADVMDIRYGEGFFPKDNSEVVISTIPMPLMMRYLNYEHEIEFKGYSGLNVRAVVQNCDAYATIYVPDPDIPFSRVSITGCELIVEMPRLDQDIDWMKWMPEAVSMLGLNSDDVGDYEPHKQVYHKIAAINNDDRKRFIAWATDKFNIFSLGRFATWRPSLLLDDLVSDVRLIERWIEHQDLYGLSQHRMRMEVA